MCILRRRPQVKKEITKATLARTQQTSAKKKPAKKKAASITIPSVAVVADDHPLCGRAARDAIAGASAELLSEPLLGAPT